jgi:protoporphyrinogen oxidase
MEKFKNIIIGGGLAGLSTAYHLGDDSLILEKQERTGGLVRTFEKNGFSFDMTGHWLHLRNPSVRAEVEDLLQNDFLELRRECKIYSKGVATEYPFQRNLHGLPPEVVRDCLLGAVHAHCERKKNSVEPDNFNDFVNYWFGAGIAEHFMIPYNTKLWGVPPHAITKDWCQRFVPRPDIREIVEGALGINRGELGYNVNFLYPKNTGIEALPRAYAYKLKNILTSHEVAACSLSERWIETNGKRFFFDNLVTTMPVPEFIKIAADAPDEVRNAARGLKCVSVRYITFGLNNPGPFYGCNWLYVPEKKWHFYRLGCFSNNMAHMAPAGKSSCFAEIANNVNVSDDDLLSNLRELLFAVEAIRNENDILFEDFNVIPHGYVIYDSARSGLLKTIFRYLEEKRVMSIGRYGRWVYSAMEDAIIDGINAANKLRQK